MNNKHATLFPHFKYKIACLAALSDEFVRLQVGRISRDRSVLHSNASDTH